jgi:hypothetical protein
LGAEHDVRPLDCGLFHCHDYSSSFKNAYQTDSLTPRNKATVYILGAFGTSRCNPFVSCTVVNNHTTHPVGDHDYDWILKRRRTRRRRRRRRRRRHLHSCHYGSSCKPFLAYSQYDIIATNIDSYWPIMPAVIWDHAVCTMTNNVTPQQSSRPLIGEGKERTIPLFGMDLHKPCTMDNHHPHSIMADDELGPRSHSSSDQY